MYENMVSVTFTFYELPAPPYLARQIELHTVSDSEQNFAINHLLGSAQIL